MPAIRSFFSDEERTLPPDDALIALTRTINDKAKAGRVNFFATQRDGETTYAIIFQDGPKRATVKLRHRPTEADVDDIVQGLQAWAGYRSDASLYSLEPPPLPMSEWA